MRTHVTIDAAVDDAVDAVPDPFGGLLPAGVQARSRATVEACVEAAVALFEEGGEDAVTVEHVRERSGVTTGSIYHHFGDLERLRALARTVRSHRSIEGPVRAAIARYRGVDSPAVMARITREQVVGRDTPEARAGVWALTDAIAASRDRPELWEVVAALLRSSFDRMTDVLEEHRVAGRIAAEMDPRATMLFSRALAHVRLLDDLDPDPVSHRDWVAVACRIHDGMIVPDPSPPIDLPVARRAALAASFMTVDLTGGADGDAPAVRMVTRARELLLAGGPEAIQVSRLRAEQGVSAGWFHRTFGDRAGLLAATRLDLLERSMRAEVASYVALVGAVTSPEELVAAVAAWVAAPPDAEPIRRTRWQRADLLVAARRSGALGYEAGRVIGAATDVLAEVTATAQARGLIRPELAPRAVARVVQSMVFGPLLTEFDGATVDWESTIRRGLLPLVS